MQTFTNNTEEPDWQITSSFLTKLYENLVLNVLATAFENPSRILLSSCGPKPKQADFKGPTTPNSHCTSALKIKSNIWLLYWIHSKT